MVTIKANNKNKWTQSHNENKGVQSKSSIYWTGIRSLPKYWPFIHKGNTPLIEQFKRRKKSLSDFQGLLFAFQVGEDFS